jgi:hypothetical protein
MVLVRSGPTTRRARTERVWRGGCFCQELQLRFTGKIPGFPLFCDMSLGDEAICVDACFVKMLLPRWRRWSRTRRLSSDSDPMLLLRIAIGLNTRLQRSGLTLNLTEGRGETWKVCVWFQFSKQGKMEWFCLILKSMCSFCPILKKYGPVLPAYNPSFSSCFFSRNSIFLLQQISQPCFSVGLSAQPNGAYVFVLSNFEKCVFCLKGWTCPNLFLLFGRD